MTDQTCYAPSLYGDTKSNNTFTVFTNPRHKLKCSPFESSLKWHESHVKTDKDMTYEELMEESYKPPNTLFASIKERFVKPELTVAGQKSIVPMGKVCPLSVDNKC